MNDAASINAQLARLDKLGGPPFVGKMVGLFLTIVPQRLTAIDQAVQANDLPALEQASHALKSTVGNLGVTGAQELCQRLEDLAGTGANDGLPELAAELRRTLDEAVAMLQPMKDGVP